MHAPTQAGVGYRKVSFRRQNSKFTLFPLPAEMHDASDIADCSCRHMSHVTSVLEHRSPKCKGPGSRGRGGGVFLIMNEREGESKHLGLS